jgi:acetolactate synthase-1/2/3 large subunit
MIPSLVRDSFRVAQEERPGPVHLELPMVPPHPVELPSAHAAALNRAAEMIVQAERPLLMLGAAASRPRSTSDLAQFVLRPRIPYFTTQMGKGAVPADTDLYMGTAALSERDYVHEAIERADLIIAIGHDTVEIPPFIMGPNGPKVIHVGYQPAHVEQVYFPQAEIVGDLGPSLLLPADLVEGRSLHAQALLPLRDGI